jgi:hypothetical protein
MHHIAVIGCENHDGVICDAGVIQCAQQALEAIVERRHVGIVATEILDGLGTVVLRHVLAQPDFGLFELSAVLLGRRGKRKCGARATAPSRRDRSIWIGGR